MSRFVKAMRIIFSLLIIIMAVFTFLALEGGAPWGFDMKSAQEKLLEFSIHEYGFYTISIISAILIIGAIILFVATLARKTSHTTMTIVDQDGKVVLTDDAIEAYAKRSLMTFPELKNIDVVCKILGSNNDRINAKASAEVYEEVDLSEFSARVKDKLREDINNFVGREIADVHITIDNNKKKDSNSIDAKTNSISIE